MTDKTELLALADEIEAAHSHFRLPNGTDARVLAAFGLRQVLYHRAGWKFIYPDTGRPGSSLRPTSSLDDLRTIYQYARNATMPAMFPSNPLQATAYCLRELAHAKAGAA